MFSNKLWAIAIGIISIGGIGYWLLTQQLPSPATTDNRKNTQSNIHSSNESFISSDDISTIKLPVSKTGWNIYTDQQLGIRFMYPVDASISPMEQRQTVDGATINEIVVTPAGRDPTRIHFFSTSMSLDRGKNIQIYGSEIRSSEFVDVTIDGYMGIRRIDHYQNNNCTNELTVVEENGTLYGFHIVQCPSHPQGHDQLRRDVTDSFEFL